jgi:DNA-binding Xre family transcriptional regulator
MKWNLRWAAARRDIWRASDLLTAFEQVGFSPSFSKVAALMSSKPVTLRLEDLDYICAALDCTVADLLEAEPVAGSEHGAALQTASGDRPQPGPAPTPRSKGRPQMLPPN